MKQALIGYTGFVGSNLVLDMKNIDLYNSKNIDKIKNKKYDLIICAGVSAIKWYANQNIEEDLKSIMYLIENLKTIETKYFVLISTVDIYDNPIRVNENDIPNSDKQDTYGKNRYFLENWVSKNFNNYSILRLPALFGKGLKKNFIYDLMNRIPATIMKSKQEEMEKEWQKKDFLFVTKYYDTDSFENLKLKNNLSSIEKLEILKIFEKYNFTSLMFTDSRSEFQFYNLKNLLSDIKYSIDKKIKILNIATEPISSKELAMYCLNLDFENIIENKNPLKYNMISVHSFDFNEAKTDYIYIKEEVLREIKKFIINRGV